MRLPYKYRGDSAVSSLTLARSWSAITSLKHLRSESCIMALCLRTNKYVIASVSCAVAYFFVAISFLHDILLVQLATGWLRLYWIWVEGSGSRISVSGAHRVDGGGKHVCTGSISKRGNVNGHASSVSRIRNERVTMHFVKHYKYYTHLLNSTNRSIEVQKLLSPGLITIRCG